MKNFLSIIILSGLILSGCDAINKMKNGAKTGEKPSQAAAPAAPATAVAPAATPVKEELCKNGEKPEVVAGTCGGKWKLGRSKGGALTCDFDWGPRIECPKGKVSLGRQAECYGVNVKELAATDKISSEEGCAEKFGKVERVINYTMHCCPQ